MPVDKRTLVVGALCAVLWGTPGLILGGSGAALLGGPHASFGPAAAVGGAVAGGLAAFTLYLRSVRADLEDGLPAATRAGARAAGLVVVSGLTAFVVELVAVGVIHVLWPHAGR